MAGFLPAAGGISGYAIELTLKARICKTLRIAIIERDNLGLQAIYSTVQVEHGLREFRNVTFFDVPILHAYIITSRRTDAAQNSSLHAA